MQEHKTTARQGRYVLFVRRAEDRPTGITASDADLFSTIHWSAELKARGKIVAGAVVEPSAAGGLPEGLVILSVESPYEAQEIAETWPVREGVRVGIARVIGNL